MNNKKKYQILDLFNIANMLQLRCGDGTDMQFVHGKWLRLEGEKCKIGKANISVYISQDNLMHVYLDANLTHCGFHVAYSQDMYRIAAYRKQSSSLNCDKRELSILSIVIKGFCNQQCYYKCDTCSDTFPWFIHSYSVNSSLNGLTLTLPY